VLVNNAGGFWGRRHVAADGLEHTFALNHLAPFLLTSLLLDRLTASTRARVVAVSSSAHAQGRLDFNDLQGERNYSGQHARVTIVSVVRPAPRRSSGWMPLGLGYPQRAPRTGCFGAGVERVRAPGAFRAGG
jgi:NAD(P)-dependent dehydrogenase (short-subunit alcohol dehydrogenase family)